LRPVSQNPGQRVLTRPPRIGFLRAVRLHSLEITNFRVIKNARLEFPDRVIGIVGPNGAGKSSIIEAVAWSLYGNQASRTGRGEIKSAFAGPDENCEVNLTFGVRDVTYRVVRRLVGKTERAEAELYRGEALESVGVNETTRYVGELLGLDWRGFLTSFLARQQELNALSDLQPSKRRDHLAGMLGIERLDKAIGAVKEDTRLTAGKTVFIERQLAEAGSVNSRIEELQKSIEALDRKVTAGQAAFQKADEEVRTEAVKFRSAQETRSEWLRLSTQLEADRRALAGLEAGLVTLKDERQALEAQGRELSSLEGELAGMAAVRHEFDQLREARSRQELREGLAAHIRETTLELTTTQQKVARLKEDLSELDRVLKTLPPDVGEQVKGAEIRLGKAREEYGRRRADGEALAREMARLEKQMASIKEFGPDSVCDRCLRPLGDDLERIREHLGSELAQLVEKSKRTAGELSEKKAEGERIKEEYGRCEAQARLAYETSVRSRSAAADLDGAEKQLAALTERQQKETARLAEMAPAAFDSARLSRLEVRLRELELAQSRSDRIRGSIARLPLVLQTVEKTIGEIESATSAARQNEARIKAFGYSDEQYQRLEKTHAEAQERRETARAELLSLTRERDLSQKELEGRLEQSRSLAKAAAELEECRAGQYYGEKLAALFAEYRKYLVSRIRPTLEELSSRLIGEMTADRYSLVELDEEYNLRLMDSGQYYNVDRFSGGEKDLANLCLRLAISLALSEAAGLDRSFVILDEVFGSQDTGRRELIVKALSNLHGRFPQILLVTHIEEIKDQVEDLILVTPTGSGWSEVVPGVTYV
jgi:exonuclease SbcC